MIKVNVQEESCNVCVDGEMIPGHPGKSAYEYAVEHGYTGTEEEFGKMFSSIGFPELPPLPSDANTKTYALKSVNGVLTWIEE